MTEPHRDPLPPPTARLDPATGADAGQGDGGITDSYHDPLATRAFPEGGPDRESNEATGRLPLIEGYDVLDVLGRGGMGVVYRARHIRLNRIVALKVILSGSHAGEHELARFQTEAETIARLSHPHIVQVYEVGQSEGRPYLALEFVDGGSLDQKLTGAPQPALAAARFVEALAQAVHYAHAQGIIHRDLKPANVLLSLSRETPASAEPALAGGSRLNDAIPKITDFGLAKKVDVAGPTVSGAVMGTPSYMAPEQAGGRVREIGTATDIYALGTILYELLTGRPPFLGATQADTLLQVVGEEPVPPRRLQPAVPRDLDTICLKCLHKQPAHRYASAGDLADDLRRFLAGEPIRARPVSVVERFSRWCRRNPVVAGLTAAVALCLVAATVIATVMAVRIDAARAVADNNAREAAKNAVAASNNAASADEARNAAVAALEGEKQAHRDADRERTRAEASLYFSNINLAGRYWLTNQVEQAERNLDDCPPDLRAWEWHLLKRLCHAESLTVAAPDTQTGLGAAFGADAGHVASICLKTTARNSLSDWSVKVWATADGKQLFQVDTDRKAVYGVALAPDGMRVALARADRLVQVWKKGAVGTSAHQVTTCTGHTAPCLGVAFSPDGRWVASCAGDGTARVWDAQNGNERVRVEGHVREVNGVAFSPDGNHLATAGADETVRVAQFGLALSDRAEAPPRVWVVKDALILRGHRGGVLSVMFSPGGRVLASTSRDGTVKVWDSYKGTELQTLRGFTGVVNRVAFSPDGRRLATAGADRTVRLWDVETGQELFALRGHGGAVLGLTYRPDGRQILSVGEEKTLKVWDATTGRQGLRLPGRSAALAFSPDGRRLALPAAGEEGAVTVWDVTSGQEEPAPQLPLLAATVVGGAAGPPALGPWCGLPPVLAARFLTLRGHRGEIVRLAFSADGHRLASASVVEGKGLSPICEVIVWDLASGKVVLHKQEQTSDVPALTFSHDGRRLVLVTEGNRVLTWDVTTGVRRTFPAGTSGISIVHGVACSPDARCVALAGVGPLERLGLANHLVHVHDSQSGTLLAVCHGHEEAVEAMCFGKGRHDDDDDLLATAGADKTVLIWDMSAPMAGIRGNRAGRGTPIITLRGHTHTVRAMAFSPDGKRLASVSWDGKQPLGEVKVWDLPAGREVLTLEHAGVDVAFSGDGARLAVTAPDGTVLVWDGTPRREMLTLREAGQALALSGRQIASAGDEGGIKLWDTRLGREVRRIKGLEEANPHGHAAVVRHLAFSGDGKLLASASDDQTVKVWDPATGELKRTLTGHADAVLGVAISHEGTRIASASADETIRIWDLKSDAVLQLKGHIDRVLCVVFSPDGKLVASGGDDKVVRVWDARDGTPLFQLGPHGDAVNKVAFSPDGTLLASAGEDRTVKVWEVETKKLVRTLEGHADGVRDVAFSADGRYLASAGWDRKVKVWDTASGKEAFPALDHEHGVRAVALGPADTLATVAADATVRVWKMKP